MTLRTWLLLALGMLLAQAIVAQDIQMQTYDKYNRGARRESKEPPLADESESARPKIDEPKKLPVEIQSKPTSEKELIPAQGIVPAVAPPLPINQPNGPVNYLATPVVTIDVAGKEYAADEAEIKYTFTIRNRSEAKAHHVLVRGIVPKNAKFITASLQPTSEAKVNEGTELQWLIGTLNSNDSRTIDLFIRPNPEENEVKVVGRVQIDHGRFLVTKLTKPQLTLKKTAPKEGVLYDAINYRIEVSNPTKIAMTDVRIEDQLGKDDGMEYERDPIAKIDPEKNLRTWTVPVLNPGDKKVFDYTVIAKKTGVKKTLTRVTASGVKPEEEANEITIHEAKLQLKVTPPARATVNQPAEVKLLVENKGTATLNNVLVRVNHPQDIEVKRVSNDSTFFKDGVQWILPSLKAGENRELSAKFVAATPGRRKLTSSVKADKGQEQQDETTIDFEGIPSLDWKTSATPTSSVGKSVSYTVEVSNPGSANATNVVLSVKLPPEVRLESAAPIHSDPSDGVLRFNPIHLPPKKKATFVVTTLATAKGTATVHFDLLADHTSKAGTQHNELTTIINAGAEKIKNPDRTTQQPPKDLPIKEAVRTNPKDEIVTPVKGEPRKEPEPKVPEKKAPEKKSEPGSLAPLGEITVPPLKKEEPKKDDLKPIIPLEPPKL